MRSRMFVGGGVVFFQQVWRVLNFKTSYLKTNNEAN